MFATGESRAVAVFSSGTPVVPPRSSITRSQSRSRSRGAPIGVRDPTAPRSGVPEAHPRPSKAHSLPTEIIEFSDVMLAANRLRGRIRTTPVFDAPALEGVVGSRLIVKA